MDPIEEEVIRIIYLVQSNLFVDLLLKIISSDIVFLADVKDAISRKSSLLISIGIECNFCDRGDREEGASIMFQKCIEHIEGQCPHSKIGKSTRAVQ